MSEKLSELERVLQERGGATVACGQDSRRYRILPVEKGGHILIYEGDPLAAMKKLPAKRLHEGQVQEGKIWAGLPIGLMGADFYGDFFIILNALDGEDMSELLQIVPNDPEQEGEGFSA